MIQAEMVCNGLDVFLKLDCMKSLVLDSTEFQVEYKPLKHIVFCQAMNWFQMTDPVTAILTWNFRQKAFEPRYRVDHKKPE